MLKSNFDEFKGIVTLAARVGARQVVISNLALILHTGLCTEAIFNDVERMDYYHITLNQIREKAIRENIIFDYHGPGLDNASLGCRENVYRACVINVDGEVGPCVLTDPVLCKKLEPDHRSPHLYIFKNQFFPIVGVSFGNIRKEGLTRIWNKEEYMRFREHFNPEIGRKSTQIRSQMPQCCQTCYKRWGV